jgi:hypothetical protein
MPDAAGVASTSGFSSSDAVDESMTLSSEPSGEMVGALGERCRSLEDSEGRWKKRELVESAGS